MVARTVRNYAQAVHMKRAGCALLGWWLALATIGCVSRSELEPSGGSEFSSALVRVPIGLCEDYPEESRQLRAARDDLELLRDHGLPVLRIAFGWDAMEPEPGEYDWEFWDEFVRMAVDEYGVRLIPYICYTPKWAATDPGPDSWRHPPRDPRDFARFIRQLVSRYRDRIDSWEVWNEPDNPHYWLGSVEDFGALLRAGAKAVREADPEATVVLGGLAWNVDFLEGLLTNLPPDAAGVQPSGTPMDNVDVVNLHNYFETWSSEPIEELPDYVGRAKDLLRSHGRDLPLWMAEIGYSSFRDGPLVSAQARADYTHEHSEGHQAETLVRMLTLLLASGDVELIAWYRIHDLPHTQEVIGDVNNRHLGVLDQAGREKPALRALTWFNRCFGPGFRCLDDGMRVTLRPAARAEIHTFELSDGSLAVVGWLPTLRPGDRFQQALDGRTVDARTEQVTVHLPGQQYRGAFFTVTGARREPIEVSGSLQFALRGRQTTIAILRPQ